MSGHGHDHRPSAQADRRWLLAALGVIVVFMAAEIVAGLLAHSLALLADAGHMLTDAAALALAVIASRIAERPARGAYTYGFARVDALSGQVNGITLLLLAVWFAFEGIRRLVHPSGVHGGVVAVVAVIGAAVNLVATYLAGRADRDGLNVRGVLAHLVTDVWAFAATFVAGLVIVWTGWRQADPVASLLVAALMAWTGWRLVHEAGRVFLEAAPPGVDPQALGAELAAADGVAELHDLHVWVLGSSEAALSAHVLVDLEYDCHEVAGRLRTMLGRDHGIGHVTLQVDHLDAATHVAEHCTDAHGTVHVAPAATD
ncbi:MAG TPA: cation diffusion facilitator family transporter [Jatrophihabitans sp.]|jgi:cobalt-zinc-cadmium efflux system protein|uniref:cation diffusion facilitator family transporter n=1 Tax=Jatrophihabitans sp. TaxID=1932789 RepID=UPI002E0C766F|nr:cation diffusion facilitator family transporter [Jatrophihabitans sp.]